MDEQNMTNEEPRVEGAPEDGGNAGDAVVRPTANDDSSLERQALPDENETDEERAQRVQQDLDRVQGDAPVDPTPAPDTAPPAESASEDAA